MARVLLIDDDPGVLVTVKLILQLAGHDVSAAATGGEAVLTARSFQPDVAFVDLRLPDSCGLDVISEMRAHQPSLRCVVVTGFGDLCSAVEAIRHGACDYLQKPVFEDDLVAAVRKAEASRRRGDSEYRMPLVSLESHDLARWAVAIVRFMSSPRDAKTLAAFGRVVGISTGAFRNWCRTARLSSRRSLQFARGLRAVRLRQIDGSTRPQKFLDIVDLRTLSKFLLTSGGTSVHLPPTVDDFLQQQKYVDAEAVAAIRTALNGNGHPRSTSVSSRLNREMAV